MRVLITGARGYVGSSISSKLSERDNGVTVHTLTRDVVDLRDGVAVNEWFRDKEFDVVLHAATVGGSRLQTDDSSVFDQNIKMFENLMRNSDRFGRFVSFGSGAELNPSTPYGGSKRYISERMKDHSFCHNIRIFAVFDENELPTRFIKSNVNRCLRGEPMVIHSNKAMDFFYMEDLYRLIVYFMREKNPPAEVNCSYQDKRTLYDIARQINRFCGASVPIVLESDKISEPYMGKSNLPSIDIVGFDCGLVNTIRRINSHALTK